MIEEMTAAYWRLRRAWAIENRLLESGMENRTEEGEISRMAAAFGELAATPQFGLLHRYETRLHVMYQRALHNLVLLRSSAVRNEPRKPSVSNTDADRETVESTAPPAPDPPPSEDGAQVRPPAENAAAPPPPSCGAPTPTASLPRNALAFPALVEESPPRRPNLPESYRSGD